MDLFIQLFRLIIADCRCRFVQNNDIGLQHKRLCDLHKLLLCNAQPCNFGVRRDVQMERVNCSLRLFQHLSPLQETALREL